MKPGSGFPLIDMAKNLIKPFAQLINVKFDENEEISNVNKPFSKIKLNQILKTKISLSQIDYKEVTSSLQIQ